MFKKLFCLVFIFATVIPAYAYPPSSRPSSHPSSSSRPSPSSRPSSRPSTPSSRPSTPSSRPKPPTPSSRPSTSNNSFFESKKSKPSSRPTTKVDEPNKPKNNFDSVAAQAKKREESRKVYTKSNESRNTYKTPSGTTVNVDKSAKQTKVVRDSLDQNEFNNRKQRVEHHYHRHYGSRYDSYRNRPYIDVGGGYSTLFWWSMLDWQLDRQAMWLYHHQNTVNQQLYAETLAQNANLKAEVDKLKANNVAVDPNYVDNEYKDNPDLMYSDEYVEAVYNPTTKANNPRLGLAFAILFGLAVVAILIYVVFFHQFTRKGK